MSLLVKITLSAALILSIGVPFGALRQERRQEDAIRQLWEQICFFSSAPW